MIKVFRGILGVVALIATVQSQAITVGFSFESDGSDFFGGTSVPGSVTGTISGLVDNVSNQLAGIRVEVLTFPSLLGGSVDNGLVATDWLTVNGSGFDLLNGVLVGAQFQAQAVGSSFDQLRLDYVLGHNVFTLDSGATFSGNRSSFAGATYTTLATVTEPSLLGLMLLGIGALSVRRRAL